MTIEVTHRHVVKADQTLTFTDESAFDLRTEDSDRSPDLLNYGSVSVSGSANNAALIAIDADAPGKSAGFTNEAGAVLEIATSGQGSDAIAAGFTTGGVVDNSGEIDSTSGRGGAYGLVSQDTMNFHNEGLLDVHGRHGATGVEVTGAAQFINDGHIMVSSTSFSSFAYGAVFEADASFDNSGVIDAHGSDGARAVEFLSTVSHFDNSGRISAVYDAGEDYAVAVELDSPTDGQQSTLTNSGVIKAEFAFHARDEDGVVLHNSGKAFGISDFSVGSDAIYNNGYMANVVLDDGDDLYEGSNSKVPHGVAYDSIDGGAGADTLDGGRANDRLVGGNGNDELSGGHGADTLTGGSGADDLSGGRGADVFVYQSIKDSTVSAPDIIRGLHAAGVIDLSQIDADTTVSGNQAFTLVDHLDGHAGEVAYTYGGHGGISHLLLDVDGDGQADAVIDIEGRHLDPSQLVL